MDRSYWDTSSILADAVRIPCHVAKDCPGLAHLQGNNETLGSSSNNATASHSERYEDVTNTVNRLRKDGKTANEICKFLVQEALDKVIVSLQIRSIHLFS